MALFPSATLDELQQSFSSFQTIQQKATQNEVSRIQHAHWRPSSPPQIWKRRAELRDLANHPYDKRFLYSHRIVSWYWQKQSAPRVPVPSLPASLMSLRSPLGFDPGHSRISPRSFLLHNESPHLALTLLALGFLPSVFQAPDLAATSRSSGIPISFPSSKTQNQACHGIRLQGSFVLFLSTFGLHEKRCNANGVFISDYQLRLALYSSYFTGITLLRGDNHSTSSGSRARLHNSRWSILLVQDQAALAAPPCLWWSSRNR